MKATNHTTDMNASRKSDRCIVPEKHSNKDEVTPSAESMEERQMTKGNTDQPTAARTQGRRTASKGLERVREAARKDKNMRFTALLHHVNFDLLKESFYRLRKEASAGIDGVTWNEYEEGLEERLENLLDRVHKGSYRAKPSKRAYIHKEDGKMRPLGIASLEDKIVQQAVTKVLNCIYEVDFKCFSYGFRPGRNQHQALDALTVEISSKKVNWVLDADIRGFFDTINHEWLCKFLEHRIADQRILRLIRKWLKAGVSEDGEWSETKVGTPQGSVISPLLANVYLHYVLDLWVEHWRRNHAKGEVIFIRYADDYVTGFQYRRDAIKFLEELRARMEKFGLEIHPDKTRLIEFGRFADEDRRNRGDSKPETFDFLGFTHICGKTRKGKFRVLRLTIKKRVRTKLKQLKLELMRRRHEPVQVQGKWLRSVVQGFFGYHGVPGNIFTLASFRTQVNRIWFKALKRRSQRNKINWNKFGKLVDMWIPLARNTHPYPEERFYAKYPR